MARKRKSHSTVRVDVDARPTTDATRRGVITVLGGAQTGRVIALKDKVVIGRGQEADVVMDDESLSRRHAELISIQGRYFVKDLDSTNGTFVDGARIQSAVELTERARIQLGEATLLRFALQDEVEYQSSRELYEASVRDPLTRLFNRHYFDERLASEFSFSKRHERSLSVVFIDADHFKLVNDTFGHPAGDEVLRRLAALLVETVRTEDIVARIGGEEFVVLVRDIPPVGMLSIGERLRSGVESLVIEDEGRRIPVTVSIGVATLSPETDYASPEGLVAQADAALFRAKADGRNRVHLI